MTPAEAREYISQFHHAAGCQPITFVQTQTRRIHMNNMTDDDAVQVALMMKNMELSAGRPEGVPVQ